MIYSFLQNGDGAITIQFENEISEEVNRRVTDLCTAIEAKGINGVIELVPTFASLTVFYDCTIITSKKLKKTCAIFRYSKHSKLLEKRCSSYWRLMDAVI